MHSPEEYRILEPDDATELDPIDPDEYGNDSDSVSHETGPLESHSEKSPAIDPYVPFDQGHSQQSREDNIVSVRAILVGVGFGALVNASNIYLGLKSGWTTSANILGSMGGFAVLSYLGGSAPGSHENNIVQTAATAAGGMASVFVSAVPALYQLQLLISPSEDFFRLMALGTVGAYFGLFFAAPLRHFFLVKVARDLRLIFPTALAVAITIRSMHMATTGYSLAWKTIKALAVAFMFAASLRIVSQYANGVLWEWHIFTWLASNGIWVGSALALESWGWFVEWTPAFIGSGMLVGTNVALSFFAGTVIAWGIIGPYLVANDIAFGSATSSEPKWQGLMNYHSMAKGAANADHPSPSYWLLWPGVACLLATAFADLALQWRVLWVLSQDLFAYLKTILNILRRSGIRYRHVMPSEMHDKNTDYDIKYWMWLPGLCVVMILTCVTTKLQFGMSILETLLALVLSFVLSLIAIQATGATDTTPLSAVSKVSQIILGATTRTTAASPQIAQRLNLLGGSLTSISASQATELVTDFRVGFLLHTPPALQFLAQLIGTSFAILIAPSVFILFANAYPCILTTENNDTCPFHAPSVQAWRAIAIVATEDDLPIPKSSIYFSIVMMILAVISVYIRHFLWTGSLEWVRSYHPSMMIVGIAFILPGTQYSSAMLMGALAARIWNKKSPKSFETYHHAIAAGFMAGEGIGGVANAVMAIVGIGGDRWGTNIGCPADRC